MNEHEQDLSSEARGPLGPGRTGHEELTVSTGSQPERALLTVGRQVPGGRQVTGAPGRIEVIVAPDLLADLDDPTLVISIGYVGPDRRGTDRRPTGYPDGRRRTDRVAPGYVAPPVTRRAGWLRRIGQVVVMTMVVAVPLTLIADRSVPPTTSGAPSAGSSAGSSTGSPDGSSAGSPDAPGAAGGTAHPGARVFTASPAQVAKAEAAYQRALARQGGSEGTSSAASGRSASSVDTTGGQGSGAGGNTSSRVAARQEAAQARTQARAQAQAAAAQRRLQAQADRAANRSAKFALANRPGNKAPSTPPGP